MAALVGRERELVEVRELLDAARAGEGSALLVHGEAGIGKSALLQATEQTAPVGTRILRTTGHESERELPFAALATLLQPMLDLLPLLPGSQAAALRGAFALEETGPIEPFAVAAATLGLLSVAAEEQPVLCVVDDVHWLDTASATVVQFAARRLGDTAAFLLLAARDGEPWPRGLEQIPTLELTGLSAIEGVALLGIDGERPVATGVAGLLVERTGGNPLALLELQSILEEDVLTGRVQLGEPLPVGETMVALFLRRVETLPNATRHALLRAAADAEFSGDAAVLEPAERAGLVAVRHGQVEFRHALLRAAVYQGAAAPERRNIHAEIAASVPSDDRSPRRALHLARAATGPDASVAAELDAAARLALGRGGVAEAASVLELAAGLTPDSSTGAQRLAEAAVLVLFGGDPERAGAMLERAERQAVDEPSRVAVERARGTILLWTGGTMAAHATLVAAAERAVAVDRGLAAGILTEAVWPAATASQIAAATATARRASELAAGIGGFLEELADALLSWTLVIGGEAGLRATALERVGRVVPRDALLDAVAATYGLTLTWLEDFEHAAALIDEGLLRARTAGALTPQPLLLAARCELFLWRGDLRGALLAGREAEQLCAQLGTYVAYPYAVSVLARAEAIAGLADEAAAHVRAALEFSRPRGIDSIEIYAATALGALALAEGRYADAVSELEPLRSFYAERAIGEPNAMPWLGDLAEAAILAGDATAADGALVDLDRMAEQTGSRWASGVAARARALRAPLDAAELEIDRAAALLHDMPFELTRVRLVHGERLRRERHRAGARAPLREALQSFEQIGAQPWADRAHRELAAAGEVVRATEEPLERVLSPQELQVAQLVAEGLTNREAAARLIVSPKTIEYHLANAYRKLGVRSRIELARRLDAR